MSKLKAINRKRLVAFVMGSSLLRASEFFVLRKMEMPEIMNHLLCGWGQIVIQKNCRSIMIEVFKLL